MSNVLYGMDSTRTIDDQIMINHATAVKKAAEKSLVFFDLPYNRDFSEANTVKRVLSIMKKTSCDGVKIEGNTELKDVIMYLSKKYVPVMAHLGLEPQKFSSSKKFKIYGFSSKDVEKSDYSRVLDLFKKGKLIKNLIKPLYMS